MCCLKYLVEQNKACNDDRISLFDNNNCSDVAGAVTAGSRLFENAFTRGRLQGTPYPE